MNKVEQACSQMGRGALMLFLLVFMAGCEVSNLDDVTDTGQIVTDPTTTPDTTPDPATDPTDDDTDTGDDTSTPIVGGSGIGPQGEGGGFLWKPESENDGRLVVLLPPQYTGQVSGVFVGRPDGSVIEQGNFSSVANGDREHYRFSKEGASYGSGIVVVADMKAGGSVHWPISNGSSRIEF